MKIFVIGSINMDLVTYVPTLPKRGETTFGTTFNENPGGKGANQACASSLLGADVTMLGAIGNDAYGRALKENLLRCNVHPLLKVDETTSTGIATILIEEDVHDNRIVVVKGANAHLTPQDIDAHMDTFLASDIIMTQLEIPLETVEYIAKKAEEHHKILILNPAPACPLKEELLRRVTYLTPNETELALLAHHEIVDAASLDEAVDLLLHQGVLNLLVTLGSQGVYYCNAKGKKKIPAFRVNALDTTAAGDCFNGAFATFLAEGHTIEESILYAQKASSICVQRKGAIPSLPRREEVITKL